MCVIKIGTIIVNAVFPLALQCSGLEIMFSESDYCSGALVRVPRSECPPACKVPISVAIGRISICTSDIVMGAGIIYVTWNRL